MSYTDRRHVTAGSFLSNEENRKTIQPVASLQSFSLAPVPPVLRPQQSQGLIKLQPMERLQPDFREALNLGPGEGLLHGLKARINDPKSDEFWQNYTNEVLEYLQQ